MLEQYNEYQTAIKNVNFKMILTYIQSYPQPIVALKKKKFTKKVV